MERRRDEASNQRGLGKKHRKAELMDGQMRNIWLGGDDKKMGVGMGNGEVKDVEMKT